MCRGIAVMLLLIGVFCGYWWFYKLAPSRRTLSPEWHSSHSQREYWREVQKKIHRGMWFHDDGFTVGMYGDKSWAEWIMKHVTPDQSMGCIGGGPCHSASAMQKITNQDIGENADDWLAWWEKNKSKSQEEWIADGFHQRGFDVDVPPSPKQASVLLGLLGNSQTNESLAIPIHMKYNAFRCLRDSGFEPVGFAISNRTLSTEVACGLLEYAKRLRHWPAACGVGILPFGMAEQDWKGHALPPILTIKFQIIAYLLVFGPLMFGARLIICSFRRKKENVEPDKCSVRRIPRR
jgi:hypothetical protein